MTHCQPIIIHKHRGKWTARSHPRDKGDSHRWQDRLHSCCFWFQSEIQRAGAKHWLLHKTSTWLRVQRRRCSASLHSQAHGQNSRYSQHRLAVKSFRSEGLKTERRLEQVCFFQPLNACSVSAGDDAQERPSGVGVRRGANSSKPSVRGYMMEILASMLISALTGDLKVPGGNIQVG